MKGKQRGAAAAATAAAAAVAAAAVAAAVAAAAKLVLGICQQKCLKLYWMFGWYYDISYRTNSDARRIFYV